MTSGEARILVVDDQPGIRFFLEEVLRGEGYQVVTAESGEAALEWIADQTFDLAVIDLVMKEVSGIEVLTALKRDTPSTAAIVLTAHGSLETAVEALRQGAHDYLLKPCKTSLLRQSVRTALIKSQREKRRLDVLSELEQHLTSSLEQIRTTEARPPVTAPRSDVEADAPGRSLRKGDLVVDFARHVVKLGGQVIRLSPTEFDVLAYLVREAPRVVSPEELACEVQGYDEPWEAADTVRYHIYRIRQKMEEGTGRKDIIRTVRGVGYTLDE
jgi:DNA-binding response OmpR family regulator